MKCAFLYSYMNVHVAKYLIQYENMYEYREYNIEHVMK